MCLSIVKCSSLAENWQNLTNTCDLTHGNIMEGVGPLSLLVICSTLCMKTRSTKTISLSQFFNNYFKKNKKNAIFPYPQSSKGASLLKEEDLLVTIYRRQKPEIRPWEIRMVTSGMTDIEQFIFFLLLLPSWICGLFSSVTTILCDVMLGMIHPTTHGTEAKVTVPSLGAIAAGIQIGNWKAAVSHKDRDK